MLVKTITYIEWCEAEARLAAAVAGIPDVYRGKRAKLRVTAWHDYAAAHIATEDIDPTGLDFVTCTLPQYAKGFYQDDGTRFTRCDVDYHTGAVLIDLGWAFDVTATHLSDRYTDGDTFRLEQCVFITGKPDDVADDVADDVPAITSVGEWLDLLSD